MNAPEGSWTVREMVCADSPTGTISQRRNHVVFRTKKCQWRAAVAYFTMPQTIAGLAFSSTGFLGTRINDCREFPRLLSCVKTVVGQFDCHPEQAFFAQ